MPYEMHSEGGKWMVTNKDTGKVHGKHMSKENAMKQMRLLYMVEGGKKPTGKK